MHAFFHSLFHFFAQLGAPGLLLLGVLDSSFLFLPLGNDLLLVVLTARHHGELPLYVAMAAGGSTLGCFIIDLMVRKGGRAGLKRFLSSRRLKYVQKKAENGAAVALLLGALAPPPFPFTTTVAVVSALNYPRGKMLGTIAFGRAVRFTVVGLLAIWMGRHILRITQTPTFEWCMGGFIAVCAVGSAISIYKLVRGT